METKVEETNANAVIGQISALEGLISPEEAKTFIKQPPTPAETTQRTPETKAEVKTETPTEAKPEVKAEVKTEAKTEVVDENLEKLKNSTLFGDVFKEATKTDVDLADWESTAKYISENAGVEVKDFKDVQKIITEYKEIKEKTALIPELEKKAGFYEEIYTSLPDTLYEAVETFIEGGDYEAKLKEHFTSQKFDINVPFKKQDKKEILDYFFPNEFSEEDYLDDDNKAINIAYKQAEKMFEDYKVKNSTPKNSYKEKKSAQQQEIAEKLRESAIKTFNSLPSSVPVEHKKKVGSILSGGKDSVMALLFNSDGTYKDDAAVTINNFLHAREEIEMVKAYLSNQIKSKTNEDIVTRMNDKPNASGGASNSMSKAEQQKKVDAYMEELMGLPKTK